MAKISINEEFIVNGKFTIKRVLNDDNELIVIGTLMTHFYLEEIESLETYRYLIKGIDVREESFGSDDYDIAYTFTAKEIIIKNDMTNLEDEKREVIESGIYNEEGYIYGSTLDKVGDKDE